MSSSLEYITDEFEKMELQIAKLKQQRDELLAALDQIARPVYYLQKECDETGNRINGAAAIQMFEKSAYAVRIAEQAIAKAGA